MVNYKRGVKKIWKFIWEDDSFWSWLLNIALAFILIKFLVYPGLGLIFGTNLPIVAVVSSSMEHENSFDLWWKSAAQCDTEPCIQGRFYDSKNISYAEFREYPLKNGFNKGDIMILIGKKPKDLERGDVIVFKSGRPEPIIHRIIDTWNDENGYHFQTKGDNNARSIGDPTLYELDIKDDQIKGKAVLRAPYLGWVKIGFVCGVNTIIKQNKFVECLKR